jgi:phage head maturation protease
VKERYTRLAPQADLAVDASSRTASYIFSDESVGRDGHIIKSNAWRTDNFEKNPVFLWQHTDSVPPIGKVFGLHTETRQLLGSVKYAETDFAESIFQLVRSGYLNAVSTSWLPLDWQRMDAAGGGLVFVDVDLLEISQVAVPALPTALATARSQGINVRPLAEWASDALDRDTLPLPRPQMEALYRAAAGSRTTSVPSDDGRAEREVFAREVQEQGARQEEARRLIARGKRELTDANAKKLETAQSHLERARGHHRAIGRHHDRIEDHARTARAVHRALTGTLGDLGIDDERCMRALADLDRCARGMTDAHASADSSCSALGKCIGNGDQCIQDVIDGVPEE